MLMNGHLPLLFTGLLTGPFQAAALCLLTAFLITLITIPPLIHLLHRYQWVDRPNARKEHTLPIPTMGGVAVFAGLSVSLLCWFPFSHQTSQIAFFLALPVLLALGMVDDRRDLPARYKFMVQLALALLMAVAGIRIENLGGFLGLYEIPLPAQFTLTVLAIAGITNAFNLIDGIDGLAGGLGFMSLLSLGLFLTYSGDAGTALICFALAGGLLAFLYFNLNPARIFMGDTGSLVLGFVVAVMSIRLLQVSQASPVPYLAQAPVMVLGIVLIPVFDTLRVFAGRMWRGHSPFRPDKTHIHHLLTRQGISHGRAARIICVIQALVLLEAWWLQKAGIHTGLLVLTGWMLLCTGLLSQLGRWLKPVQPIAPPAAEHL